MRHARREMCENLITIARIATGGHVPNAIRLCLAPGRTYPEIARRSSIEILLRDARDRSPVNDVTQPTRATPGSPYSNSRAFKVMKTIHGTPARGTPKRET